MAASKRYPRERFTRSLVALCKRLDELHRLEFEYVSPRGDLIQVHGRLRVDVRVLWAFGSWALGAPDCGDLDLALDIKEDWVGGHGWGRGNIKIKGSPGFDPARKAILKAPPLVRILDAGEIRRRASAGEIVVDPNSFKAIWLAPDLTDDEREVVGIEKSYPTHWSERIAAIKIDPNYQRAPRATDTFPLEIEQTGMNLGQLELAVLAQAQGLIEWVFLPHGQHRDETPSLKKVERDQMINHQTSDLAQIARVITSTREVLKRQPKTVFRYGDRWGVFPEMFESWKADCIVITPRWRANWPNGSLVITKGANYSVDAVKAFRTANPR